jgi:hypothetical protein
VTYGDGSFGRWGIHNKIRVLIRRETRDLALSHFPCPVRKMQEGSLLQIRKKAFTPNLSFLDFQFPEL